MIAEGEGTVTARDSNGSEGRAGEVRRHRGHKGQRLNGTEQLLFGVNRVRQPYQRSLLQQANGDEKRQLD